jgi:hypothetical protein
MQHNKAALGLEVTSHPTCSSALEAALGVAFGLFDARQVHRVVRSHGGHAINGLNFL